MNIRVLSGFTSSRAIALEVVEEGRRVVSQVTKVDGFSSLLQQQQPIEDLKELSRRLMNPGRWLSSGS